MPSVTYRDLEPVTVYAAHGVAPGMGPENVGPIIGPLIEAIWRASGRAGCP